MSSLVVIQFFLRLKRMKSFIELELFARCQDCFIVGWYFLGECSDIVTALIQKILPYFSFRHVLGAFFPIGRAVALLCYDLFGQYL